MKITKEHIEKLKQLDRIEYRQKRQIIEDYTEWGDCTAIPFLILISSILIKIMGKVYEVDLGDTSISILKASLLLFALLVSVNLIGSFVGHKKLSELDNQYFKSEVKK